MGRQYDDALEFLLDGAAESISDGRCTNLTPSNELRRLWARWGLGIIQALHIWERNYPETMRAPVGYLLAEEEYPEADVYFTLSGSGIGIWDGRWDPYFVDRAAIDKVEKYLKQVLRTAFGTMEQAIQDEALRLCDEEDDKRPKQKSLFS
jgi:hypothetical protein